MPPSTFKRGVLGGLYAKKLCCQCAFGPLNLTKKVKMLKFSRPATALALILISAQSVFAASVVEVVDNGMSLHFNVNEEKLIRIKGLPVAGKYRFHALKGVLYAQLPDDKRWWQITSKDYLYKIPSPYLERHSKWAEYEGQPTYHWVATYGGQICAHMFTSQKAAQDAGINFSHLSRLSNALTFLVGDDVAHPCENLRISPAMGKIMGFPVSSTGRTGEFSLQRVYQKNGTGNAEEIINPLHLNAEVHAAFLKLRLTPAQRAAFESASANLPFGRQVTALKKLLRQQSQQ